MTRIFSKYLQGNATGIKHSSFISLRNLIKHAKFPHMITAFVELSSAITTASLSLSAEFAKLISLYVIWGFKVDPSGDPKEAGDPYCTLFVGRISHLTSGRDSL